MSEAVNSFRPANGQDSMGYFLQYVLAKVAGSMRHGAQKVKDDSDMEITFTDLDPEQLGIEYLLDRGEAVQLQALDQPPVEFDSVLAIVEQVAQHESAVTASIYQIYGLAKDQHDFATQAHLDWFVTEQVEEEKSAGDLLDRVRMVGDNQAGLMMVDHHLGARSSAGHEH